jgi:hypothetical protein
MASKESRIEMPLWVAEALVQTANQMKQTNDLLMQIFNALAGLAFLFALQALAMAALVWKVGQL